jgi:hypothetical protein
VQGEAFQLFAAVAVRLIGGGLAVEVQHVEDVQGDRYPAQQGGVGSADGHPLLQQREAGSAGGVQGDYFGVEGDIAATHQVRQYGEFGEGVGGVAAGAGQQPPPAARG